MKVLIIIPAYNEEANLPSIFQKIKAAYPQYEILVINDCSHDQTSEVCNVHGIPVVNLPVNLGIGGAVQTGYKYAHSHNFDIAIQLDGDGQHNPDFIPMLIEKILEGNNLCIGSRFVEKKGFQSTYGRRMGIKFLVRLIKITVNQDVTDPTSGFRACDRQLIRYFSKEYPRDYPEPETIVAVKKHRFKIAEVSVIMNPRQKGNSSIRQIGYIYYLVKVSLSIIFNSL